MGIIYNWFLCEALSTELTQQHKSFLFDPIFYGTQREHKSFLYDAFSLELTQKHEFLLLLLLLLWPNSPWNLHRTQEFPLWWHFLWKLYKNMSFFFFYDPIFIWNLHSTRVSLHATFSLELTQHNLFDYFWRFNTFLCKLFIYLFIKFQDFWK